MKRLFSSSLLSAIRMVPSAYLRLLIFLPALAQGHRISKQQRHESKWCFLFFKLYPTCSPRDIRSPPKKSIMALQRRNTNLALWVYSPDRKQTFMPRRQAVFLPPIFSPLNLHRSNSKNILPQPSSWLNHSQNHQWELLGSSVSNSFCLFYFLATSI